jgi:predicted transcriptional regulator YdeE
MKASQTQDQLMEPLIIQKEEIVLVGVSFYGDPFDTYSGWDEENEIGRLWQRFMKYQEDIGNSVLHITNPEAAFEVHVYNQETSTKGFIEVFVGLQVDRIETIPVELLVKVLPATTYAVFTFEGEAISSDWHMEIDQWITAAGYERAHSFSFQYLDQRFKGVDRLAESILDVYMPVKTTTP